MDQAPSGASIGDIIGAALDKDNQKNKKKLNNEKNDFLIQYFEKENQR